MGPRYHLLKEIADDWEFYFKDPDNVTVEALLDLFQKKERIRLSKNLQGKELEESFSTFLRASLEPQIIIRVINEYNRIHHGANNPEVKGLFYYPDFPCGEYRDHGLSWKQLRIKPLKNMRTEENIKIVWRKKGDSKVQCTPIK